MLDAELIRVIPRFSDISPDALAWLCERAILRTVEQGEMILIEEAKCTHFYMVLEGEVKVFKVLESGREIILGIFRSGEGIGEVAVLDGGEFPANAAAHQASTLLLLRCQDYLSLLETFPDVARAIIRDLNLRMRALRVRVETLSENGVQSRIAQMLQSFGREMGQPYGEGILVPMKLNRAEIAGMVGARMETVIRIMSRLKKKRIVTTSKEGFLLENPTALEELITDQD